MKNYKYAYLLVVLYVVAMLRPISPFVEYAINYDYISKVLCINKDKPKLNCNGKCHLMQELEKQQENDFNTLQISMEDYPIGFVTIIAITSSNQFDTIIQHQFLYQHNYSFQWMHSVFHPPTV